MLSFIQIHLKFANTYIYKEQKQIIWIHQAYCQKAMLHLIIHLPYMIISNKHLTSFLDKRKKLLQREQSKVASTLEFMWVRTIMMHFKLNEDTSYLVNWKRDY